MTSLLLFYLLVITVTGLIVLITFQMFEEHIFAFFFTFFLTFDCMDAFTKRPILWSDVKIFFKTWYESYKDLINDRTELRKIRAEIKEARKKS